MAIKKKNRNIVLLKSVDDLKNEIKYDNFEFKTHFIHLCNLKPNKELEKIEIEAIGDIDREGLVYVFVIDNYIFKIGHTITSIKERIQSYNCGKTEYRIAGTNSTTNYFVLQSILNINKIVKVYAFFPEQPKYELFGKKYQDSFPVSKRAENIILNTFSKKPIGNVQK